MLDELRSTLPDHAIKERYGAQIAGPVRGSRKAVLGDVFKAGTRAYRRPYCTKKCRVFRRFSPTWTLSLPIKRIY